MLGRKVAGKRSFSVASVTSTEIVLTIRDGDLKTATSISTDLRSEAYWMSSSSVSLYVHRDRSDYSGRSGSQGRPPRLSHKSWAMPGSEAELRDSFRSSSGLENCPVPLTWRWGDARRLEGRPPADDLSCWYTTQRFWERPRPPPPPRSPPPPGPPTRHLSPFWIVFSSVGDLKMTQLTARCYIMHWLYVP